MKALPIFILALILASCVSTAERTPVSWRRIDGQSLNATEKTMQQFNVDRIECVGEAAQSGSIIQPVFPNIYMIAAAQGQRNRTESAVMQACMAKRGYLLD